jgi:hypothetical protein
LPEIGLLIEGHARHYYQVLDEQWQQTDWTRFQAEVALRRIPTSHFTFSALASPAEAGFTKFDEQ